jgi:pSer/pThr/pTyr-binding forkhead associated (FHA) protein
MKPKKIAKLVEMTQPTRTHNVSSMITLEDNEVEIGRYSAEHVELDIMLGEGSGHERVPSISAKHATLRYDTSSDSFILIDHSRYGTKVNDELVHNSEKLLPKGCTLLFADYGPVVFLYEEPRKRLESDTAVFPKV